MYRLVVLGGDRVVLLSPFEAVSLTRQNQITTASTHDRRSDTRFLATRVTIMIIAMLAPMPACVFHLGKLELFHVTDQ